MVRSLDPRIAFTLLVLGTGTAAAQSVFDSVNTARGRCPLWQAPPGGSNAGDLSYSRCSLDRIPRLRSRAAIPAPVLAPEGHGTIAVFVNEDGTVNTHLTRWYSVSGDSAFHRQAVDAIRAWHFEPGMRGGSAVRSGFSLHINTDFRQDTLPSRVEWRYAPGAEEDTLSGRWVVDPPLPPFTAAQLDSIYLTVVRRLTTTRVVRPQSGVRYCLSMPDGDQGSADRLARLAQRVDAFRDARATIRSCEGDTTSRRIVLPRVYRTERDRAILMPNGDFLPFYPPSFDGTSWRAWWSRCVITPRSSDPWLTHCSVGPDVPTSELAKWYRTTRDSTEVRRSPARQIDSVTVTVEVMTREAWQIDTLRVLTTDVPVLNENAVFEPSTPCGGWQAFTRDPPEDIYYFLGDLTPRSIFVALPVSQGAPGRSNARAASCRRRAPFFAFLLGGVGKQPGSPLTLCYNNCAHTYTIDPKKHTLARPIVRFRISDLREATRAESQLAMRIRLEPDDERFIPLAVIQTSGLSPFRAYVLPRNRKGFWEYNVTDASDNRPPNPEVLIYLVVR